MTLLRIYMFDLKVRLVWLNVASLGLYNSIAVKKSLKKLKLLT